MRKKTKLNFERPNIIYIGLFFFLINLFIEEIAKIKCPIYKYIIAEKKVNQIRVYYYYTKPKLVHYWSIEERKRERGTIKENSARIKVPIFKRIFPKTLTFQFFGFSDHNILPNINKRYLLIFNTINNSE